MSFHCSVLYTINLWPPDSHCPHEDEHIPVCYCFRTDPTKGKQVVAMARGTDHMTSNTSSQRYRLTIQATVSRYAPTICNFSHKASYTSCRLIHGYIRTSIRILLNKGRLCPLLRGRPLLGGFFIGGSTVLESMAGIDTWIRNMHETPNWACSVIMPTKQFLKKMGYRANQSFTRKQRNFRAH